MAKFKVHIISQNKIHVPTAIRKELDTEKVVLFLGIKTFVVYPEDAELADVLSSLMLIQSDLEQRLEIKTRNVNEDRYNGKIESNKLNDTENRNGSSNPSN